MISTVSGSVSASPSGSVDCGTTGSAPAMGPALDGTAAGGSTAEDTAAEDTAAGKATAGWVTAGWATAGWATAGTAPLPVRRRTEATTRQASLVIECMGFSSTVGHDVRRRKR